MRMRIRSIDSRASWVVYLLLLSLVSRSELLAASGWCTTPSSPSWRAAAGSGGVIAASDVRKSPKHTIHWSAILSQPHARCLRLDEPQVLECCDVLFVVKMIEGGNSKPRWASPGTYSRAKCGSDQHQGFRRISHPLTCDRAARAASRRGQQAAVKIRQFRDGWHSRTLFTRRNG